VSLAALKSMRWVLQAILKDATIVPAAKFTGGALGYVGVNMVAFPALLVGREGAGVVQLAAEVSWDAAREVYELTAPTPVAAVASVFGLLEGAGTLAAAGTSAGAVGSASYAAAGLVQGTGVLVQGAGDVAGKGVEYIGVPLAAAGIALGGGTLGAAVLAQGAASGGALAVTGETGAVAAQGFGDVLAGATLAGGTAASAGAGGGYAAYELSRAVVVPPGYGLASGIILNYGTLSQLSAQTILGVSDCAYVVLSLEGPRWVLYAVKGNLGRGENLPPGAVLDLKKMQEAGETIYAVPATREELRAVVNSVYDDLPEYRAEPARP